MTQQPQAPFVIGTDTWPGVAKVQEECGEMVGVLAKLMAFPDGDHPDGAGPLVQRIEDEVADVHAATAFLMRENPALDQQRIRIRAARKLALFTSWHRGGAQPAPTCAYCGKDEQDGVGVIVEGACGDCRRAWS